MPASYTNLHTYRYAAIIYDLTVKFCQLYILTYSQSSHLNSPDKRTADQMIQAARSGKQNIVEGSEAMHTSLKSAIKLTNVAKASLEELLQDYEDFLRQRNLRQWEKNDARINVFRAKSAKIVGYLSNLRDLRAPAAQDLRGQLKLPKNSEKAANLLLTLCHQATYLLNNQVKALERKHQQEGGYTEKLFRRRTEFRKKLS